MSENGQQETVTAQELAELRARISDLEEHQYGGVTRRQALAGAGLVGGGLLFGSGTQPAAAETSHWNDSDADGLLEAPNHDGIDVGTVDTDSINNKAQVRPSDTEADIQRKIDADYSVIEFGEGTWEISNGLLIDNHRYLVLRGGRESVLKVADGSNLSDGIIRGSGEHLLIENLRFYGNTSNQSSPDASGVNLSGDAITVRDCNFLDFWVDVEANGHGIRVKSDGRARITGNRITNVGRHSIYLTPTSGANGNDVVRNNDIRRTKDNPYIDDRYQSYGILINTSDALVQGNSIDWTGTTNNYSMFSILLEGNRVTIDNNLLKNSVGEQIYAKKSGGQNLVITSNQIHKARDTTIGSTSYCIAQENSIFAGNVVTDMADNGFIAKDNSVVANNVFRGNEVDVYVKGNGIVVTGNSFYDTILQSVIVSGTDTVITGNYQQNPNGDYYGIVLEDNIGITPKAFIASNWLDPDYSVRVRDGDAYVSNNYAEGAFHEWDSNSTIHSRNNWP